MADIVKDREKLYAKQLAQAKARSAGGVAGLEMGSRIASAQDAGSPVIISGSAASTPAGYLAFNAANDARAAAGQMPLGDANAARAASNVASSASGGAMIPSNAMSSARMQASMPNTGANAFVSPQDAWMNRAKAFTAQGAAGTNQQLQMQRNEMGTNNTSLTQMAAQIDPSIKRDAERARQWRIMTPQQRREEVDRLAIEQDARTANQASQMTSEDIQKYGRNLADASGTFIDSYGRSNPMYSPDTQMRIREHQRRIEKQAADMFSSYDKSKWQGPEDMRAAIAALPAVQEAGPFGEAIAFNIQRKYSTPQMRAQMDAEDRNQKLFADWMTTRGAEEIDKMQTQAGGQRFTNDGTGDVATQIFLNRDKDLASGQIYRQFLAETPQVYTAIDGKVQIDQAQSAKYAQGQENQKAQAAKRAESDKLNAKSAESDKYIEAIRQINPEYADRLRKNSLTGEVEDLNKFKQGTEWGEIDAHRERIYALDALLETAKYTTDEEAWAWAQSQYPVPEVGPGVDPNNPEVAKRIQEAQAAQAQAFKTWQMMIKNPENRRMLEAERYNRQLAMQGLQSSWQSPPTPQPAETGIWPEGVGAELTMGALSPSVSVPAQTAAPAQQPIQAPITAAPQAPVPVAQEQKPKDIVEFKGQAERTFAPSLGKDSQAVIDTRYSDSVPVHYWNRKNGMQAEHGLAVVPVEQLSEFIARQDGANLPMVSPSKPKTAEEWARIVAEVESETGKEVKGRIIVGGELIAGGDYVYSEWKSMVRKRWKQELKKAKRA